MKARIMILGAGIYQVPLIMKARSLGLETLVVSPRGAYPGIALADILLDMDTTDIPSVVAAARQYGVAGIVTTGTDVSVPSVAAVAEELGLHGPARDMAGVVSSKTAFRAFLARHHLNCPGFAVCREQDGALRFYRESSRCVVMKPDDSSGSRGVSILGRGLAESDVALAYEKAKGFSRSGLVCAEDFIPGTEVGGDAFFHKGELAFFTTTCKHMNGVVVQGHSLPGRLSASEETTVKTELLRVADRLGYTDGPLNFDVIVGEQSATVLEMGLRNGGNGIVDLIFHCYGVDLAQWLLAYALGESLPQRPCQSPQPVSSYIFGSPTAGRLVSATDSVTLKARVPEVLDVVWARQPGDPVQPLIHNANLVGYVLLDCGVAAYDEVASRLGRTIEIEVAP